LRKILEKFSKEQLIDFIVEYAEDDADFENAVNVSFREPEYEQELGKIAKKIDRALSGASEYKLRGGWGCLDFDIDDIVAEISKRTERGQTRLAFAQTELLYRKLLEIFEYQEECEVSEEGRMVVFV